MVSQSGLTIRQHTLTTIMHHTLTHYHITLEPDGIGWKKWWTSSVVSWKFFKTFKGPTVLKSLPCNVCKCQIWSLSEGIYTPARLVLYSCTVVPTNQIPTKAGCKQPEEKTLYSAGEIGCDNNPKLTKLYFSM